MIVPYYPSPQTYDDDITKGSPTHIRLVFYEQQIIFTDEDISIDGGIQITSYINPNTNISFGGIISKELVVNFINSSKFDGFDWTDECTVEFAVDELIDGYIVPNYVPVGVFKGTKPTIYKNSKVINFVAHDLNYYLSKTKLANDFSNILSPFPVSYINFGHKTVQMLDGGQFIYSYDLLSYFENNQLQSYPFNTGITYGKILQWFAESNCANAINRNGGVAIKKIKNIPGTISYRVKYANCYNINIADEDIDIIDTIIISSSQSGSTDYVYPIGSESNNYYKFVDNPLLLNLSDADKATVCSQMLTFFANVGSYKPMEVDVDGGVLVEAGDIIPVEIDENGTTINMPVFKTTLYWNGSCRCVYECTGDNNRSLTKEQQDSYELNGIIEDSFTKNFNLSLANNLTTTTEGYALDARQGKVLNDNLTDLAKIHPSSLNSVSDLVTAINTAPDNYLMFAYGSTLGNILTGKNRSGYGLARKSGSDYVLYDVCDSYGEHFGGDVQISTSIVTQRQLAFFYIGSSVSDMIKKTKIQGERTFTFYASATLTNELCGKNTSSFGICMYSGGYLMWNLITYNDEHYRGWYKESDDSTKVYIEGRSNGGIVEYYTKTGVSIPDNAEFTVDLTSDIPSGYSLWDANVQILYNGNAWYHLPYFNNSMNKGMWIVRVTGGKITIRCNDSAWGTCDIYVTAFLRHT